MTNVSFPEDGSIVAQKVCIHRHIPYELHDKIDSLYRLIRVPEPGTANCA